MLARCLDSVFAERAPGFRYRVRIVYNGPDVPGATDRIEREYPQVEVIREPGPLGFCLTHNRVLRECDARYALVLDDDTVVADGTLSRMVAFMDAHPDVGLAGCRTLNPDGSFQPTFALRPSLGLEMRSIWQSAADRPESLYADTATLRDVPWLNGSFMLVRKEAMDQVGVLDERYYTYFCEADWAERMEKAGWRVVFVPDAEIVHVGGQHSINTLVRAPVEIDRGYANRFYYFAKHRGRLATWLLRPVVLVVSVSRIAFYGASWLLGRGDRAVARSRIDGFLRVARRALSAAPDRAPPLPPRAGRAAGVPTPPA
jgi:GT2 family glycosyltransferase